MQPRFSLKLLMLLILMSTLLLAWWRLRYDTEQMLNGTSYSVSLGPYRDSADRLADQKRGRHAIDKLTELGGTFIYEYQLDAARSWWGAEFGGIEAMSRWHNAELKKVPPPAGGAFVNPILLEVEDQRLIDENGLKFVADLPTLRYIRFVDVTLRDEDWKVLEQFKHLNIWQHRRDTK